MVELVTFPRIEVKFEMIVLFVIMLANASILFYSCCSLLPILRHIAALAMVKIMNSRLYISILCLFARNFKFI